MKKDKILSPIITGIRNVYQAEMNTAISDLPDISEEILIKLPQTYLEKR